MTRFICFLLLFILPSSLAYTCMHDNDYDVNEITQIEQPYAALYPSDNNTNPIRMRIDTTYLTNDLLGMTCTSTGQQVPVIPATPQSSSTYTCGSNDVLTPALKLYLLNLLTQAQSLFQGTLKVIPIVGPLVLQGSGSPQGDLYGGVYVSSEYTNGAPDLDVVIFVTARPILQDGGGSTETLAVAKVVQQDQIGRPIMGHLNINPGGIATAMSSAMYKRNFGVVIHEMTHSLGFTLPKLKAVNPDPATGLTSLVQDVLLTVAARSASTKRTVVVGPSVKAWAKKYYGCDSVQGVELENQGGSGTAGSHWEKRIVMNEYMTGTASRNPVFSELTLALMQDTGWYRVNYSQAGQLLWGQGMGCNFINRGCDSWPNYNGYFCSDDGKKGCTADYQAKGECRIDTGVTVSTDYQYFSGNPTKVGVYDLPDFCPFTSGYENGWCFDTTTASSIVDKGEVYGENSRCFESSLVKNLPVGGTSDSACYETYCTGPQELRLKIGDYWYLCPAGSDIKVIGYGGVVSCPAKIQQICAGASTDSSWPAFVAISPNSGGPGLRVNITGTNFVAGTTIKIGDPLTDVVVYSSTLISATIPNSDRFRNPTNLIQQQESVIITDPKGRSTVGYNKFTIKVKLDKEFVANAIQYLKDNPLITAAIFGAIVISCAICGYCCWRQKGKAVEAEDDYY